MEKNNSIYQDIVLPSTMKPKVWHTRDLYQEYAAFILKNDPQCWGKYNKAAKRKNYWIYKTVPINGKVNGEKKVVEVMNYKRWKQIMEVYFAAARRRIIYDGSILSLGHLGRIWPKRLERSFAHPTINWQATNKQPKVANERGEMVPANFIYYTDPDYIRIGWRKNQYYTNEMMYQFKPTTNDGVYGPVGFREEFSRANIADPNLKYKYDYFPLKSLMPRDQEEEDQNDDT